MYEKHFGFRELPFNITPDPKYIYYSESHRRVLDHMVYGIEHRKGFVVLIGEVGCGKSMTCRALLRRLSDRTRTAYILNPLVSGTQLLRSILDDLGLHPDGRDRLSLIGQLNAFLLDQTKVGNNVAVIIDEAQDLPPEVLEQIRLLSNLETDQHKLLQIILVGQPELETRLNSHEFRQLRQRILVRCRLRPLTEDETREYVRHRLTVAGGGEALLASVDEAAPRIHAYAQGIPRLINNLCDSALLVAYVTGTGALGVREVEAALAEVEAGG